MQVIGGSTNVSVVLRIVDSSDGTPETGVVFNTSGIDLWYRRELAFSVDITEADLATPDLEDVHLDGGFLHINDGYYRLDVPDAAFAAGVDGVQIGGTVTGMVVFGPYVQIDTWGVAGVGLTETGGDGAQLTEAGGTGDHLTAINLPNQTMDIVGSITGNLSGSVGSVTGAVGSVTGVIGQMTGITQLAEWLGAGFGKQAANATAITEIKATGAGSGTYDETTDSQEAIVDVGISTVQSVVSVVSTGLDLVLKTSTFAVAMASAIWDRVLTGATHNIATSAGRRLRGIQEFQGYENGAVWIDTVNGTAGTTDFENGTVENPVDTIADANTIAASLSLSIFHIIPGSSITLAAAQNNQVFIGIDGWTLALGGQDVAGSSFIGASVSGVMAGTGTTQKFIDCLMGATSLIKGTHLITCGIAGTMTVVEAMDVFFDRCHSAIAGTATWVFDFGAAIGNTNLNMRNYSGGVQLENMGDTGTDTASIEGRGQIIEGTCTGGTVAVRGLFTTSGITNLTLSDDARYDAAQINAQVDGAWTTQMADSVSTDGAIATREQALRMVLLFLTEFAITGVTYSVKKEDGTTEVMTFTLDDASTPTSVTRAT